MKQYRVFRVSIMEPCGGPYSAIKTCSREFNTLEEALNCVNTLRAVFPKSYVTDNGTLARKVEFHYKKQFSGIDFDIVYMGTIFWQILEHGDGLPMPIRIH